MSSKTPASASRRKALALVLGMLFLGKTWAEPPAPAAHGPLVIIGGALAPDNAPIYRAVLEATLPDRPLCLLATASSQPRRSLRSYLAGFRRYEGEEAALALDQRHPDRVHKTRWVRRLEACGGFFFTGGDQSRLVDILRPGGNPSAADQALRRITSAGALVAGTSAGAAMMSHPMIGDGSSGEALAQGVARNEGEPGVWLRDGMGFLAGALVDQHFLARGRFGRLLVALHAEPTIRYGFGIDEDTALVIDADSARVIGSSAVIVLDQGAPRQTREPAPFRLWLLANDDQLQLASGIAEGATDKLPLSSILAKDVPDDPWVDDRFHHLLMDFARSPAQTIEIEAGRIGLSKEPGFRCLGRGPAEKPRAVFAGPFAVTLRPPST